MRQNVLAVFALGSLLAAPAFCASDLKVIANPAVKISEISADDLKSIFLGTVTSLKDAGPVQPVLDTAGANLGHFATGYLGKTSAALATYYRSLMFTGKWSMPVSFASDAEVVDYVAKTRGAIGFVSDTTTADQVKTLKVK